MKACSERFLRFVRNIVSELGTFRMLSSTKLTITIVLFVNLVAMVSPEDELEHNLASNCHEKSMIKDLLSENILSNFS